MSEEAKAFFEKFKGDMGKMQELAPGTVNGFMGFFKKVMTDGAMTSREKELVALGIGVAVQCGPCIRLHTQKCLDAGATKEQIIEAASVAVMMAGGPAFTHLGMVIETLEALGA